MLYKKGLGHVEAILSFVIFIGFLVFAFVFFSPFHSGRTRESTLEYAWRELGDVTAEQLDSYSVFITQQNAPPLIAIAIPNIPANWKATVQDRTGVPIASYTDNGGTVHFQRPTDNFVRIKYSPSFLAGSGPSGTLLPTSDYSISSSETKDIRFEHLFTLLSSNYTMNYTGLKKQFNLPTRVDFGFSVKFADGSEVRASKDIPEGVEVLSQADHLEIVRMPSGKIEYADVSVFVW